jgi:sulfate transport system substrate-binding protein
MQMKRIDKVAYRRWARPVAAFATSAALLPLAACGGTNDSGSGGGGGDGSGGTVDLVAYSTPQEVYENALIPAFQETPEGEDVDVSTSFGPSGDQSRGVEAGLGADLVHFALETDVTRVVDAGIVADDWNSDETEGGIQNSVVVFAVRPGNPKGIETWEDLIADDVEVVTPNPFTSGGARWNIMAAYGQALTNGATEEEALDFVAQVLGNTNGQEASARDALTAFTGGKGDVLLAYENEAITAINEGEELEYVVPDDTILIETKSAVPTDLGGDPEAGQAFLDFLRSDEGQRLWAENGFRPVNEEILAEFEDTFPTPGNLFTIEEFGGWETVATDFFDSEAGSIAEIERELGVATE